MCIISKAYKKTKKIFFIVFFFYYNFFSFYSLLFFCFIFLFSIKRYQNLSEEEKGQAYELKDFFYNFFFVCFQLF